MVQLRTRKSPATPASTPAAAPLSQRRASSARTSASKAATETSPSVTRARKVNKDVGGLKERVVKRRKVDDEPEEENAAAVVNGAWRRPGSGQLDYQITASEPTRDEKSGEFVFDDFPSFRPNVSPEQMMRAGSFGGGYFRPIKSKKGLSLTNDWKDIPEAWYSNLDVDSYLTNPSEDDATRINKWGVKVGLSYAEWEKKGWIMHDERQIGRWFRIASPDSGRWRRIIYGKYLKAGANEVEPNVETVSKGIRQTLLHWAYEPTTHDLNVYLEEKGLDVANHPDDMDE